MNIRMEITGLRMSKEKVRSSQERLSMVVEPPLDCLMARRSEITTRNKKKATMGCLLSFGYLYLFFLIYMHYILIQAILKILQENNSRKFTLEELTVMILAEHKDFDNTDNTKVHANVLEAVLVLERAGLINLESFMDRGLRRYHGFEPVRQLQIYLLP